MAKGMGSPLFRPFTLGTLTLPNRIVMSPMTRGRVPASGVPDDLTALYYAQRASAGLILTEGTCPAAGGVGMPGVPGIREEEHVAGWRRVVDGVRARGGRMVMQLWHCGRVSLAEWQPEGRAPIGPSAVPALGARSRKADGTVREPDLPREATVEELQALVDAFARAAANARRAGCEGVEIHACNGYLLHQFFSDEANRRSDRYGGSALNRVRLAVEIAEAIAAEIGAERTGIRISPLSEHQSAPIGDPYELAKVLVGELDRLGLAYVHCVEGDTALHGGGRADAPRLDFRALRRGFGGAWIANNAFDRVAAEKILADGGADLVSFGRLFIANPDLVERFRRRAPLNALERDTVYRQADPRIGYTDYPALA